MRLVHDETPPPRSSPVAVGEPVGGQSLFGEFLRAQRLQCTPEQVGLPPIGRPRRVSGLRREEVASLAAISTDYYTRLEQGRVPPPSHHVRGAIAAALRLNEDQRAYLDELARRISSKTEAPSDVEQICPQTQALLDCLEAPALALGPAMDVLAWNPLAARLFLDFSTLPHDERNLLRLLFVDPRIRSLYPDSIESARVAASLLRMRLAKFPRDSRISVLAGELCALSAEFCRWWNANQVASHSERSRVYAHPDIGQVTLDWTELTASVQPHVLIIALPPADQSSKEALRRFRAEGPS